MSTLEKLLDPAELAKDHIEKIKSLENVNPQNWYPRGIGSDRLKDCLITGTHGSIGYLKNISGYVTSKEAGAEIVRMFGGRAWLDYREHEPNYIQVKVGVAKEFEPVLERLMAATLNTGVITVPVILWAIAPDQFPRNKPIHLIYKEKLDNATSKIVSLAEELKPASNF